MALRIGIILGSTRPGRRGDQIAAWVLESARAHGNAEFILVDLADQGLGNLDEPGNPNHQQYVHEHTRRWGSLIERFDGYVFVVPEYNHSYPGALKNALDFVYREWNNKVAGIVSYGGRVAGVRAAEALRLVLAELQVATVRAQPAVPIIPTFASGAFLPDDGLADSLREMLDQVLAWSGALRSTRVIEQAGPGSGLTGSVAIEGNGRS